jgi:hypothetical protein
MNGADNDQSLCVLKLFNPSSTTFVKHFIARLSNSQAMIFQNSFCAGYFNVTLLLMLFSFQNDSGNIDAGDICLYGIA